MHIFWLCNVEPPVISQFRGAAICPFGGWLDETSRFMAENNKLTICYPADKECDGSFGNIDFYGFDKDSLRNLGKALNDKYDIYHIWGTEGRHSLECIEILERQGMLDRCVVSIQGLISLCAEHYADGLSDEIINRKIRKKLRNGGSIRDEIEKFKDAGEREKTVLRKAENVIGRTAWDEACVKQMNPSLKYYKCNENLRKGFYEKQWSIDSIKRNTIFVSQCSYPLKGMHYLLEALPLVKRRIPEVKVVTTGVDLLKKDVIKNDRNSYHQYLSERIRKLKLDRNIEFKGTLNSDEMVRNYLSAHMFVNPSTIENSSNSIGEAMLIGCPTVASYVGGTMSMLENGEEGFLYQANSKEMLAYYILRILENDDVALKLSYNSRKRAGVTHDISKNNNDLLKIYEDISLRRRNRG